MKEIYNAHDKEIKEIRTEFGAFKDDNSKFKTEMYKKIENLFEELKKPIFTDKQIISITIGIVAYLVIAVNYVGTTDARSLDNNQLVGI